MKLKAHKGRHTITHAMVLVIVLCLVAICYGVVAKYTKSSTQLRDVFSRAVYDTPTLTDDDLTVTIGEHDYPVYVRVSVVPTWQTSGGIVYYQVPTLGTDYSFTYSSTNWTLNTSDGYYYYNTAVAGGTSTLTLASDGITLLRDPPTGYTLHVELLTETIQAIGTTDGNQPITAVMDAWKVQPDRKEDTEDGNSA